MRSTVALLILALLACQALAAIVPRAEDAELQEPKFSLLCKGCKKFFEVVKDDLPEASEITKELLENVVNNECDKIDWIPFVDKICKKLLDWGIDKLFDLIVKEDGKIDPQHDCEVIKLC